MEKIKTKIEEMLKIIMSGHKLFIENFYSRDMDILEQLKNDITDYKNECNNKEKELLILYKIAQCEILHNEECVFYIYGQYNTFVPNYTLTFQEVLKTYKSDEKHALNLLRSLKYKNAINFFEKKYVNAELFIPTLLELYSKISEKVNKQTTYLNEKALRSNDNDVLINEIYQSGLSSLDFYFYNAVDISKYNKALNHYKNTDFVKEINQRENYTLPLLKKIVEQLGLDEFDIISYYNLTKINISNLKYIAKRYNIDISRNASIKISQFISNIGVNIDKELNGYLVINSVEVSRETKEKAINYIKDNDIPLNVKTYDTMIRRLIK